MNSGVEILSARGLSPAQDSNTRETIYTVLSIVFKMVLTTVLGLTGMCVNAINTVVFYKMGLSDGVTQNFFILSISDGVYAIGYSTHSVSYVATVLIRTYIGYGSLEILAQTIYWGVYYTLMFPFLVSMSATIVIAVVRCYCVVMPLKVKYIITARRQLAAILAASGIAVSVFGSCFSEVHLVLVDNPQTNLTTVFYKDINWHRWTGVFYFTMSGGYFVLGASVAILSVGLRRAAKFRKGSNLSTAGNKKQDNTHAPNTKTKDNQRDARIVRVVLFTCIVFMACSVPAVLVFLLRTFVPGMSPIGKYKFSYEVLLLVTDPFSILNVTINFFIYFNFNSRYHSTLKTLFGKNNNCN